MERQITFYDRPITRLSQLYGKGHRDAVETLEKQINSKVFAAVIGPRRVGKTSVVKTCLSKSKVKFIYFDLSPYIGHAAVSYKVLVPTDIGFDDSKLSVAATANLALLNVSFKRERFVGADVFQSNLVSLLREINQKFDHFAFVIDEAQVLAFIKGMDPSGFLQLIHNNYDHISVVLTGSMPGMLLRILRPTDANEPSFARYVESVNVPKWSDEEAQDFLESGLKTTSTRYKESEIQEVVGDFSGTPGFLSYYGLLRTKGRQHTKAYDETGEFAANEWKKDINAFLKIYNSPNYVKALKISAGTVSGITTSELTGELGVDRSTAWRIIKNLVDGGMFIEEGEKYSIADRPLKKAIQTM